MNNDTLSSKQITHWLADAEQVLRTADESSDEYAAARAISTLGLALLGTGDELRNLRARNSEVESLLAIQQRAIESNETGLPADESPVARLIRSNVITCSKEVAERHSARPLYIEPQPAAWYPAEISPDVPRGEFLDCWVVGYVCERDYSAGLGQYKSAQPLVLLAHWGGTELLRGGDGGWSFDERLPDEGFKILAWQPIAEPDFPLETL
ncbi:hypothetical protein QNQ09_002525 [Salmonella enterica]|nr:hypothetical protein [Salmonella enterica subsp. enterica serovar Wangata]EGA9536950.1 hypothetical protein [Salmonella enterica]ELU0790717.1 hypothetical protein [Salmonella enterica]